jgi:uncharacterized membrane protein YccC
MIIEFVIVPVTACALFLFAVWRALTSLAAALHWPSWAPLIAVATFIASLIGFAIVFTLLDELRTRRKRREQAVMEQRYPECHLHRLSSEKWFLTDRTSGREYQPDGPEHAPSQ